MLAAQENEAHLRTVPVGDDNAIAVLQEVGDVAGGRHHGCVLVRHAHVLLVFDERVAAYGDDNCFHSEPRALARKA